MGDFWYRGVRVEAFVGIRRADLDPVLIASGAPATLLAILENSTEAEPLHVALQDEGYVANTTPRILVLDAVAVQIDAGLNEVPTAVCEVAVGRDAGALAAGTPSAAAISAAHLIERYLGRFVPARVYARRWVTSGDGADDGDSDPYGAGDWEVLFDGLTVGPTRRGTAAEYRMTLHLTHFTAVLGFSSSLAGNVSPGTELPYALNSLLFRAPGGVPSGVPNYTNVGYVTATLGPGGEGLYTDFWGYEVPADPAKKLQLQGGVRTFLRSLAQQDLFDWAAFLRADLGGAFCPDFGVPRINDRALAALNRIEPFSRFPLGDARATWKGLKDAMIAVRQGYTAVGVSTAVTRGDITRLQREAYYDVGYRYGVPLPFYSYADQLRGALNQSVGFASDLALATLDDLAPSSFWDLLTGKYANRYQFAIAPMADRAVVLPFQPLMDRVWATISASEMFSWNDDVRNPVPVRGVVLMSQRRSDAGFLPGGVAGGPGAHAQATADAVYDSCQDGVFVYRSMPGWLVHATRHPHVWLRGAMAPRTAASVPLSTGNIARAVVDGVIASTPAAAGLTVLAAYAALGVTIDAVTAPTDANRSTANRMARALFQQLRTQPRNVYVSTRYRTDIGPGSVVALETPSDVYVKDALADSRDSYMTGIVLRMTLSLDRERQDCSTHFQIGYVRSEGELARGNPLFSDSHAFWSTACLGVPWADSSAVRARLGDGSTLG